jgi:hypothetical protein
MMALGTKKYILRFGVESKKDMLVKFRGDETLRENLARVIPTAIRQGLLPESCSVDYVEVDHKDRTLNLDLPMREQNVNEYEVLTLRDLLCSIKITMRITPDKSSPIVESVTVGPNDILKDALKNFMAELRHKHKFYGRRFKKYKLMLGERKLDLDRSLRAQDVKKDIKVVFKPRIMFEWPPGLFWPPGPYTTYFMCGTVIALVVAFVLIWSWARKDEFRVTVKSSVPCKFYYEGADGDEEYVGESGVVYSQRLPAGKHVFKIFPRTYPMYEDTLELKPAWHDTVTLAVDPIKEFKHAAKGLLRVRGRDHRNTSLRGGVDILVNRHTHNTNPESFADLDLPVYLGTYEVEYDIDRRSCLKILFGKSRIDPLKFIFDLRDPAYQEVPVLEFTYRSETQGVSDAEVNHGYQ